MGKHLDLDDVCHGNPEAGKELAELRAEVERLRKVEKAARDWDEKRDRDAAMREETADAKREARI